MQKHFLLQVDENFEESGISDGSQDIPLKSKNQHFQTIPDPDAWQFAYKKKPLGYVFSYV